MTLGWLGTVARSLGHAAVARVADIDQGHELELARHADHIEHETVCLAIGQTQPAAYHLLIEARGLGHPGDEYAGHCGAIPSLSGHAYVDHHASLTGRQALVDGAAVLMRG